MDPQSAFHPLVAAWFVERFAKPTAPQAEGWREISSGRDTLIAAPTGSGKTLAAFLWSINRLVERSLAGELSDRTQVVYVSPLKALGNDIEKNLQTPLREIREGAVAAGMEFPEIRVAVRSGDTPQRDRARMLRRPPHILITTPESLYILLTAQGSRDFLSTAETVIVDEIHAVAGDKRGSHLALSLERLDALAGRRLQRIGLSATQKPIDEIAALLVGNAPRPETERQEDSASLAPHASPLTRPCSIVDVGHRRPMELSVNIPDQELGPIATHELWGEIYERIVEQVNAHRATLVFVSTRRLVERVAHQLSERLGADRVAAHHGSLSRETRLRAEQQLKSGEVPVVVATASLELGIDIGHVDLVCHIGSPRLIATLLQRVGRSGHWLGAIPRGILYPLTRDDLMQCAAAIRAVRAGELDRIGIPENPLDILAQQMVAIAASGEIGDDELYHLVRRAYSFRRLSRDDFDEVAEMLSEGIATGRGRRSAHLHHDRVNGVIRPRRGARLAAITSGGAIPDLADYDVIEEPTGAFVGKVHEDFAVESLAGDIFLLGNQSWRIRRVENGRVRVEDAHGAPPTIPFWLGEAPARSMELSAAVSDLREQVAQRLLVGCGSSGESLDPILGDRATDHRGDWGFESQPTSAREGAIAWLQSETGLDRAGAEAVVVYVEETLALLGTVPTQRRIVAERFFDEAGGMQLVLHSPFGGRINRAWGLSLRKRFCVTFDFELQAAATDDGIVISLGEQHSFPLESVFRMVRPAALEADLTQAALQSPMFTNRWRWNASRALALLRHERGRRVPMNLQRMRAEDLLAAVFPASVACQDNQTGPIVPPDHPLVNESIDNCLHEAMDIDGLREILLDIERGAIEAVAVETPSPSAMSHEILNANPYAFLDDAPLEERRARAVALRRTDPDLAGGIGALDPEAIAVVRSQAWPDIRDAEELHDALLTLGLIPLSELGEWTAFKDELVVVGRASVATWSSRQATTVQTVDPSSSENGQPNPQQEDSYHALVAAERINMVRDACGGQLRLDPPIEQPSGVRDLPRDDAVRHIVQGWLEAVGPTTAPALAQRIGLGVGDIEMALAALEGRGAVLRGQFTRRGAGEGPRATRTADPGTGSSGPPLEWCERRLLARIHRLTLGRLRQEIEPVTTADLMRFLFRWQHVSPGTQLHGKDGIAAVIRQLQGIELPAPAWEAGVLPGRIAGYNPSDLEQLCLAGVCAWGRLSHRQPSGDDDLEVGGPVVSHASRAANGYGARGRATLRSAERRKPKSRRR
jgi:ATP-dependent Lhr-like helicase